MYLQSGAKKARGCQGHQKHPSLLATEKHHRYPIMNYLTHSPSRKGFTLIELLIVVAIIAILAGLGFGAFKLARNAAKRAQATKTISDLIIASDAFYDNYNYLPLSSGENTDTIRKTDNELMAVLIGLDTGSASNPDLEQFFEGQRAKGKGTKSFGGLYQTNSEALLYGPWQQKQEDDKLYRIVYDYDFSNDIEEPEGIGNEIIRGYRQIAYLFGKDGKAGPGGANADNVYSYKSN